MLWDNPLYNQLSHFGSHTDSNGSKNCNNGINVNSNRINHKGDSRLTEIQQCAPHDERVYCKTNLSCLHLQWNNVMIWLEMESP